MILSSFNNRKTFQNGQKQIDDLFKLKDSLLVKEQKLQSWKLDLKKFELDLTESKEALLVERSEFENEKTMFLLEKENFTSKKNKRQSLMKLEQREKLIYQKKIQELVENKRTLEQR